MKTKSLAVLRHQHPRLIYRRFTTTRKPDHLAITFDFLLEPAISFTPTLKLPLPQKSIDITSLNPFVFHLGLIELLSYWKAACPREIVIQAGFLDSDQSHWWRHLLNHGLGEFFYQNRLDFSSSAFVSFTVDAAAPRFTQTTSPAPAGDLILVGGGKDSAVALNLLAGHPSLKQVLLLNPTPAALKMAQIAGYKQPLVIERTLDPQLIELNAHGYLNGHTPFSAYLAFLSLLAAPLHGFKQIIVANEQSAGEGSLTYHGQDINHQYSKSYRFESDFRRYTQKYLTSQLTYFSLLRPLTELQIGALFSQTDQFDSIFSSCNQTRNRGWCGRCPKCAFVYLLLNAFLPQTRIKAIFGPEDFFTRPVIIHHLRDLVGLGQHKPFDCVGTSSDTQMALILTLQRLYTQSLPLPAPLTQIAQALNLDFSNAAQLLANLTTAWDHHHHLPPAYVQVLKAKLNQI
ncbi:hypothetical protein A2W24_05285 [Microgenomates group bacterium RBG_16_45_19]|nr:MAG: hypothetical protein A2W24_05285 [Microgenomates group bacterium RBG_16_45_19]